MFISCKKINFIPPLFCDIEKIMQTYYFGYFGNALKWKPKMMVSACRNL